MHPNICRWPNSSSMCLFIELQDYKQKVRGNTADKTRGDDLADAAYHAVAAQERRVARKPGL